MGTNVLIVDGPRCHRDFVRSKEGGWGKKSNTLGVFFFSEEFFSGGRRGPVVPYDFVCREGGVKDGYTDGPAGGSIVYPVVLLNKTSVEIDIPNLW